LVEEEQYDVHLTSYVENVVAFVKKEKIYQSVTGSYEAPSEHLMKEVEKIIGVTGSIERHRQNILGRIAAYKIDHPEKTIDVKVIFLDLLKKIQEHYHNEQRQLVDENFKVMLQLDSDGERNLKSDQVERARVTFSELERRFGYDHYSARECLKFLMLRRKAAKK
jgi:predicted Ser/Thr protein kinase